MTTRLGVFLVAGGLVNILFWRQLGRSGARWHERLRKFFPWFYRVVPWATSPKVWAYLSLAFGPILIIFGIMILVIGSPS